MMQYTSACQTGHFETELFGCFSDCNVCCYATFCYPYALAHAWADVRGDECSVCHCHAYELYVKANLRVVRGMPSDYCRDKRINTCCPCCSLVQDIKEIKIIKDEIQNFNLENNYIEYNENSNNFDQISQPVQNYNQNNKEQQRMNEPLLK